MHEKKKTDITVLHLLLSGNLGGIEKLCLDIGKYSECRNIFCFLETGEPIAKEMKKNGNRVYILKRQGALSYLQCPMLIQKICRKEQTDIIVTHHENPWIWSAAVSVSQKLRIPIVAYVHCEYKDVVKSRKHLGWMKEKLYRRLLRASKRIVCISEFVAHSLSGNVPEVRKKIRVVYNGIPLQRYQVSVTKRRHGPGQTELIYVGRLIPEKGVSVLLKAFHDLQSEENHLHLTIVGYGPEEKHLREMAQNNGNEREVTFTGRQEDVVPFLKKADIFIHPAMWNEGFGLTLVEAMCAGVIPVAVGHGSIPELIRDGKNGFLVKSADKEEIAGGIKRAMAIIKTGKEIQMRRNAQEQAQKFSIERTATHLDNIFLKISNDNKADQH